LIARNFERRKRAQSCNRFKLNRLPLEVFDEA